MAEPYGGPHSPEGSPDNARPVNAFRGRKATRLNVRAGLMFLAPLPLLFAGIGSLMRSNPFTATFELGALAILLLSAWLLRDGLKAEEAYNERKIARPPMIPRKLFAAVLSGIGVLIAAYIPMLQPFPTALGMGLIAAAAHLAAFGLDPMKKKGMTEQNEFEVDRAARAIEKAEVTLKEMHDAASRIKDRPLEAKVERFGASVREMFKAVEEDPRDLTRARKFLGVYLKGARDATIKYANLNERSRDAAAKADYEKLLDDLSVSFNTHREKLLLDDKDDLEIEIEVLRERLEREGLPAR